MNPQTLLCEKCGYVIEGLAPDAPCPECATPIAASMPERRAGTPWQSRRPGVRAGLAAVLRTDINVLNDPLSIWHAVRVLAPKPTRLSDVNALLCSVIVASVAATIVAAFVHRTPTPSHSAWYGSMLYSAAALVSTQSTLMLLMWIEYAGIRTFGAVRRWRISPAVARAVVDHASVGWLAGAIPMLAVAALFIAGILDNIAVLVAIVVLAALALLTFETLVYIGFRAMRFANHDREPG